MKLSDKHTLFSRRQIFWSVLLTGAVLLLVCSIGVYSGIRRIPEEEAPPRERPTASVGAPGPLFVLREFEEKIGIFEEEKQTPFQILDVYVFTLPERDQIALQGGIRIYSEEELWARIEDFTG